MIIRRIRSFLTAFVLFVCCLSAWGQRERNYIYLFDCTRSMVGHNGSPVVMSQTQDFLKENVGSLSEGTDVSVILFQDRVLDVYSCDKGEFDWEEVKGKIDKATKNITNTNICDPWRKAEDLIDKNKDNYLILLTDGGDNVNGIPALADLIKKFCGKHDNTRGFYVKLTDDAIDLGKDGAQELMDAIKRCPQMYLVDATSGIKTFFSVDMANASTNTLMLEKPLSATSSAMERIGLKVENSDPFFNVEIDNGEARNGRLKLKVTKKNNEDVAALNAKLSEAMQNAGGGDEYPLKFRIKVTDDKFELCNPEQVVRVSNKPERMVMFSAIEGGEVNIGEAEYYPSFLFWGERKRDTLKFDLTPKFSEEAQKDNSYLQMKVEDRLGRNDYTLLLNGLPIAGEKIRIDNNSGKTELGIVFNRDAKEGKRYFDFKFDNTKAQNLERINTDEVRNVAFSLRAGYDVGWNPLKWVLLGIGVVLLAALLLWFLVLKGTYYPGIKVGKLEIAGGEYFASKKIKGARMVVLTNKKASQSFLNKLFTGEIIYIVSDEWVMPITMTARKKGLKVKADVVYDIETYMEVDAEYEVKNTDTKQKYNFQVSK